ncbi:MAG: hypothetical protein M1837_007237 [Sclerophora amabilis]|nr:MAG: hypothetical protein M1837_007237 [Sclerophora amabilis]
MNALCSTGKVSQSRVGSSSDDTIAGYQDTHLRSTRSAPFESGSGQPVIFASNALRRRYRTEEVASIPNRTFGGSRKQGLRRYRQNKTRGSPKRREGRSEMINETGGNAYTSHSLFSKDDVCFPPITSSTTEEITTSTHGRVGKQSTNLGLMHSKSLSDVKATNQENGDSVKTPSLSAPKTSEPTSIPSFTFSPKNISYQDMDEVTSHEDDSMARQSDHHDLEVQSLPDSQALETTSYDLRSSSGMSKRKRPVSGSSAGLKRKSHDQPLRAAFFESESSWVRGEANLMTWLDDDSAYGTEGTATSVIRPRARAVLRDIPRRPLSVDWRGNSRDFFDASHGTPQEGATSQVRKSMTLPRAVEDISEFRANKNRHSFPMASSTLQARASRHHETRKRSIAMLSFSRPLQTSLNVINNPPILDDELTSILSDLEHSIGEYPGAALNLDSPVISQIRSTSLDKASPLVSPSPQPHPHSSQAAPESLFSRHHSFSIRHRNSRTKAESKPARPRPVSLNLPSLNLASLGGFTHKSPAVSNSPGSPWIRPAPTPFTALFPSTPTPLLSTLHATLLALNYVDTTIAQAPSPKAAAILGITSLMETPTSTHQTDRTSPPPLPPPETASASASASTYAALFHRVCRTRNGLKSCAAKVLKNVLDAQTELEATSYNDDHSSDDVEFEEHLDNETETSSLLIRILGAFVSVTEEKQAGRME